MKVKFANEQKKYITVSQLPAVKRMIAELKSDYDMNDYAPEAVRIASGESGRIFDASAEIAQNCRVFNLYGDDTEHLDVWLTIYALTPNNGFYEIGAYLSDVWEYNGTNAAELRAHMYIRHFAEIKD